MFSIEKITMKETLREALCVGLVILGFFASPVAIAQMGGGMMGGHGGMDSGMMGGGGMMGRQQDQGMTGQEIYEGNCIACHGADGKGRVPGAPDFTTRNGVFSKPDGLLIRHITEGFQSPGSPMAMPAKGGNPSLTETDIRNVLVYLRRMFGR